MKYTDEQLKRALAKMFYHRIAYHNGILWHRHTDHEAFDTPLMDTQILEFCQIIETGLRKGTERGAWLNAIADVCGGFIAAISATWQQRVLALARVKGIEI